MYVLSIDVKMKLQQIKNKQFECSFIIKVFYTIIFLILLIKYSLLMIFEQKRNSFFNLHRPELKGLNIVFTKNNQEKLLQLHILKEVESIHKTISM